MKINMSDFFKKNRELYCTDAPGYYAPFALWKMETHCKDADVFYLPEYDCYYVIKNKHLLIYYSPDSLCHISIDELNSLDCISMRADMFDTVKDKLTGFKPEYCEHLHYDKNYIPPVLTNDKFDFVDFDFSNEEHYEITAKHINGSDGYSDYTGDDWEYNGVHIQKIKANYTEASVFDPSLWFFVRDKQTKKLIGHGISTYQESIKETLLDWIHIAPEYQGKGAGRLLMQEIIRRSADRSDIIQVGGTVEFYKRCGFYTKRLDVWAPKPGYSFYGPCTI